MRRFRCCVRVSDISRQWRPLRLGLHVSIKDTVSGTDGFPGRTAPSAAACFYAVFLEIGPICVTWTGIEIHLGVVVRSLVEVLDEHTDWCSKSSIELCP